MNPSYNAGGISSAGGTAGVPGAKPGVIASGPDEPVNAPEMPPSPKMPAPMSLGGSGRSGGGARKWILIAGGVLIAVLIVVLIVFAVMPKGNGGGNNDTASLVSPTTIREQFNSFYHYLTSNNPGDTKDVSVEDLMRTSFYINNTDLTSSQRDKFLNAFNDELNKFIDAYGETSGEQPLDNVYAYVYALHKLEKVTIVELRNIYNSEGVAAARKKITDAYQNYDADSSNTLLDEYIISEQEYLAAFVDSLETGNENGLADKQRVATQAKDALQLAAYYDLEHLYSEVYGVNLSEGASA